MLSQARLYGQFLTPFYQLENQELELAIQDDLGLWGFKV